jgi:hypothetical protein
MECLHAHYNRQTNKSTYMLLENYADSVIKYVNLSFTSNADNFQVAFPATKNDDTNPFGPARGNFNTIKQSRFITQLIRWNYLKRLSPAMPTNRDPRLRALLTYSLDTTTVSANMPVA